MQSFGIKGDILSVKKIHYLFQGLKEIPEDIELLENLEELALDGNKLTSLPEKIGKQLKRLSLRKNLFESIPEPLLKLQSLVHLELSGNKLRTIKINGNFPNLERFFLENCSLEKVELEGMENLESLMLDDNHLTSLEVTGAHNLRKLFVPNNKLEEIPEFVFSCKKLEILSLHENKISHIPKEIGFLTEMKRLFISRNENIKEFPCEIGNLKKLETLFMLETSIKKVPIEIFHLTKLKLVAFDGGISHFD